MDGLKIGGAPLHPALVHFPIAAWTTALVADGAFLATGAPSAWAISFWALAIGALTGLLAMALGWLDYALLSQSHRARVPARTHMLVMTTTWMLFLVDLLLRSPDAAGPLAGWLSMLTLIGFLALAAGGHMGARLVYLQGVNVSGAHERSD